jgi:polysaccharide biosynthesis/export protein
MRSTIKCDVIHNISRFRVSSRPAGAGGVRAPLRSGDALPAAEPRSLPVKVDTVRRPRVAPLRGVGAAALGWLLGLATLLPPAHAAEPAQAAADEAGNAYRIGVDDRLQVAVWRNPELSITVPVRPDGQISVPLLGDVRAGGRLPREVAADIEQQLKAYLREPKVAVILIELRSHEFISRVRVTGAVRQPISIPHRQGMTVLDAVLQAGGVSEFASPNRTRLYRKRGAQRETFDIKLDSILERGELDTNLDVQPGDIITVPERVL